MTKPLAPLVMKVGAALYGPQAPDGLSRNLPMAIRTVHRIAAAAREGEDYPAAAGALRSLPGLLEAKIDQLNALIRECDHEISRLGPPKGRPDFAELGRRINGDAGPLIRAPDVD